MNLREKMLQATARGWCTARNSKKIMDSELAEDIVTEVLACFDGPVVEVMPFCCTDCDFGFAMDDGDDTGCARGFTESDCPGPAPAGYKYRIVCVPVRGE